MTVIIDTSDGHINHQPSYKANYFQLIQILTTLFIYTQRTENKKKNIYHVSAKLVSTMF